MKKCALLLWSALILAMLVFGCEDGEDRSDSESDTSTDTADTVTDMDTDSVTNSDTDTSPEYDTSNPFEYFVDGGIASNRLNLRQLADIWWANQFDAQQGGERIYAIKVAFGGPGLTEIVILSIGDTFTVGVWDDPNNDGQPDDAVLLSAETTTITQMPNTNTFETVMLSNPATVSDSFFVGVFMALDREIIAGPASLDGLCVEKVSYFAVAKPGTMNLEDIQGTSLGIQRVYDEGAGCWMLRALGVSN